MASSLVIKDLNIIARTLISRIVHMIAILFLADKKGFSHRIVMTVSTSTHAGLQLVLSTKPCLLIAAVL